ncbi:MAG TPA: ATP-binding protein [Bryobacteraceae bacterium]|nr:ATP-binding protein [Bryobacteraceae bacterium]
MEAVIFIGIQGSGKSTFYRERCFDTHLRISLDLVRTRNRERDLMDACLRTGQRFVIDNTNARTAERAVYIAAAKRAGFHVTGYYFETPLRDALARNRQRAGKARIPVPGVIATHKRLEPPTPAEGFDELYVVTQNDRGEFLVAPWTAPERAGQDEPQAPDPSAGCHHESMVTGLTPGFYANRSGEYEVLPDGTVWLIGGQDLPPGTERQRVDTLPPDAAMTHAAMPGLGSGGTAPPGRGPEAEQRGPWTKPKT